MNEEVISKEKIEERYKKVIIRTEETVNPFTGEKWKRHVVDLIHEGSTYYIHIEISPFGTTYSGDMGSFMFQPGYGVGIFKGNHINPGYWSEKITAAWRGYYEREFDIENVNRAYKEEVLNHYEYEWGKEYFEEAKKAWEMSDDDFETWYEKWSERDDEEVGPDYAEEVKRVREAGKPSDYTEHESKESAYDAVEQAAREAGFDWDFETIGYIATQGKGEDYRFLYACSVLQWVANKIIKMEAK